MCIFGASFEESRNDPLNTLSHTNLFRAISCCSWIVSFRTNARIVSQCLPPLGVQPGLAVPQPVGLQDSSRGLSSDTPDQQAIVF
jgi:hypothetical protein